MPSRDAIDTDVSGCERVPLVVPDLGSVGGVRVSLWLVPVGAAVLEGDRVVELVTGGATIDLEAPVAGTVVEHRVEEDDPVSPGMILADILPATPR